MTGQSSVRRGAAVVLAGAALLGSHGSLQGQGDAQFRSGVDLVNVTATVTDRSGRFVPGLEQSDFIVYEDGRRVEVTHFGAERVPVSLGIVLDASGSMVGDKLTHARGAIERFLDRLLDPEDEVFVYDFANDSRLLQDWTTDRSAVSASLRRVRASGGTAMYDAVLRAVPMAQRGTNPKKAVVLISDGNDSTSRSSVRDVRQAVRETEVLVYAVGVDGQAVRTVRPATPTFPPLPLPFPVPGRGRPRSPWPVFPQFPPTVGRVGSGEGLNVSALRAITDESGGRTEVVRAARDLEPATASIADELSRQYHIGYPSPGDRDGRWREIKVEMRDRSLRVRARQGYIAS